MPKPFIEVHDNHDWQNWHRTHGVGGRVECFFTPRNAWADNSAIDGERKFEPGLAGLKEIVRQGEAQQRRVRAVGSGWSLSAAAFVSEYLVNTSLLTAWSLGMKAASVTPAYQNVRDRLVFAQCGTQISKLNTHLEQRGLALATSGASNGQTIAGATSTGTHGSAHRIGSLSDRILALHIVAEGGRDYLIQMETRPAVTRAYANWLGAELLENDELFKAAVVSFGSFGLIHAILFEAAPLYLLGEFVKQFDYGDVIRAALEHDIRGLALADGAGDPYHIEFVFNPYRRRARDQGAFVRIYYERAHLAGQPLPVPALNGQESLRSPDLVSVFATGSDILPQTIPGLLQNQLETSALRPTQKIVFGTPGQTFGDSTRTNGGTSVEFGVPLSDLQGALDAIFEVTDKYAFGAPVALRYVPSSPALLAFTHFAPLSCTIEMPGIDSARSREGHERIEEAMTKRNVRHTYHWGQALPADPAVIRRGFGDDRVDRWLAARRKFLTTQDARRRFSNPLLERCGLAD